MPNTKTTWEDLSNLGWYKQQVYNVLNESRGGTMEGLGDMALNSGFATDYQWYCYNDYLGKPQPQSASYNTIKKEDVVWEYRNNTDTVFKDNWTESWTNTTSVDASVTQTSKISIENKITVQGFFETGFSFSFEATSSESQHKEETYQLSHSWTIEVPPGGHRRLRRTKTTVTGTQDFFIKYGLSQTANLIGTKGRKYDGHYYWSRSLNGRLGNPSRTMIISGALVQITFDFILEDVPDAQVHAVEYPKNSAPRLTAAPTFKKFKAAEDDEKEKVAEESFA